MTAFSPGAANRLHEYSLKFLLVGDSDVGKNEILDLIDDESRIARSSGDFCTFNSVYSPKTTYILLEGRRIKLQLWDTSGQGRFSTIIRSYSRGAQGILVVYDITNRWSFDGIGRWLKEIDEQAPGLPKILVGNRLHLEFRRAVARDYAEHFAKKRGMEYFEVSTLASFNIHESLTELSRLVLVRNGMERLLKSSRVSSLQDSCCRCVVRHLKTVHDIDKLPIPPALQLQIKSFADSSQLRSTNSTLPRYRRTVSDAETPMGGCGGSLSRSGFLAPFKRLSLTSGASSSSASGTKYHVRARSTHLTDTPRRAPRSEARNLAGAQASNRQCVIM